MIGLSIDRRTFFTGVGASLLLLPALSVEKNRNFGDTLFVSAYRDPSGTFGVALLDELGDIFFQEPLPARGHGVASHPDISKVVMFARRPGNFALALDLTFQSRPQLFHTRPDRHFYGHGTFSRDGKLLYATENDFEAASGVIGVYDTTNEFRRVGEFPSGGVGPHDMLLMTGGAVLCVANGGIETHPSFGRQKLNLDRMQSNICFIDANRGEVLKAYYCPNEWSRLSMRHIAVDQNDRVWFGGQYEGSDFDQAPTIGSILLGDSLQFLDLAFLGFNSSHTYVGSVMANKDGTAVAFTAPKDGQMFVVDPVERSIVAHHHKPRVCGVAARNFGHGADFITSSEVGNFANREHQYHWDNHIGRTFLSGDQAFDK